MSQFISLTREGGSWHVPISNVAGVVDNGNAWIVHRHDQAGAYNLPRVTDEKEIDELVKVIFGT